MTLEPLLLLVILRLLPSLAMVWKLVPEVSAILIAPVEWSTKNLAEVVVSPPIAKS